MKDDDSLPTTTAPTVKKETSDSGLFGRGRYKFWALAAIILLAFWSMLTGTVTLRWSAGNLNSLTDDIDTPIRDDLDVLEMEDREKAVNHMWDIYTNSRRIKLPKFWQEAFEAAYEELTSDAPDVKEAAITEIAKMSIRSIDHEPLPVQSTGNLLYVIVISAVYFMFKQQKLQLLEAGIWLANLSATLLVPDEILGGSVKPSIQLIGNKFRSLTESTSANA
ncbi:hypothetical protein DKX38_007789 [Salix brachista]|uniref:Uncharacterized protein n=1 Tax=Salix brachista TaxID=2182728 RepID=A0A5N5MNW9_9ROSI|nr:hypothetical protein DKX38_007789 [Salix brachista]